MEQEEERDGGPQQDAHQALATMNDSQCCTPVDEIDTALGKHGSKEIDQEDTEKGLKVIFKAWVKGWLWCCFVQD